MQNKFIAREAENHPADKERSDTYAEYYRVRLPVGDIAHNDVSEIVKVMQERIEFHNLHSGSVEFKRSKRIENRREVHPQPRKNAVDMFNIAEPHENGCEEEADTCREKENGG